jgi:hypothetical protein
MTLERKSFDLLLRAKPTPVPLELGGRGTIAPPDLADRLILFEPLGQIMQGQLQISVVAFGPPGLSDLPTALRAANMQKAVAT